MQALMKLRYRLWLLFGGRRTECGFRFLSKDILKNRKLISNLHRRNLDLEFRLWELEDHTHEETMKMLRENMDAWKETFETAKADEAEGGE